MFYKSSRGAHPYSGLPYNNVTWYDIKGQPFGTAANFNAIIFNDAANIVDTKGAMAIGGNFTSPRGLSLGYGNEGDLKGTGYSPDLIRFLVGKNIAMRGPLVVIGHVVTGGNFNAARGSTYLIGKSGNPGQEKELSNLYQMDGGSRYWKPSDREDHYAISSYDVPRYIPAARIGADVREFFENAKQSISKFYQCLLGLLPNGTVTEHYHELILKGNDPAQNVFIIDARPNGVLDKEIRLDIPEGSLAVVIFRTGPAAHLKYGLMGDAGHVSRTLYVFEDAADIYMDVPAAIWGSMLAPQAVFHAHKTGGNVNGNAAFDAFEVDAASGFEFHLYPFVGGAVCENTELPAEMDSPAPVPVPIETPPPAPVPAPIVAPPPAPVPAPIETPPPAPVPVPIVAPPPARVPAPMPRITAPVRECPPCPAAAPCPEAPICPECPAPLPQKPCPECPPCNQCPECPPPQACPPCEEAKTRIEYRPYPVLTPITRIEYREVPCPETVCTKCLVQPGVIFGCIWGCSCCDSHDWDVKLYRVCSEMKVLLFCERICDSGCFRFEVPYEDCYVLEVCPVIETCRSGSGRKNQKHKPILTLKNVGVSSLMIDF